MKQTAGAKALQELIETDPQTVRAFMARQELDQLEADARALWAYRVLNNRQNRINESLGFRGIHETELIREAEQLVAAHHELDPDAPRAVMHEVNGHVFPGTLESVDSFGNCDRCGEQFGARYVRGCLVPDAPRGAPESAKEALQRVNEAMPHERNPGVAHARWLVGRLARGER